MQDNGYEALKLRTWIGDRLQYRTFQLFRAKIQILNGKNWLKQWYNLIKRNIFNKFKKRKGQIFPFWRDKKSGDMVEQNLFDSTLLDNVELFPKNSLRAP